LKPYVPEVWFLEHKMLKTHFLGIKTEKGLVLAPYYIISTQREFISSLRFPLVPDCAVDVQRGRLSLLGSSRHIENSHPEALLLSLMGVWYLHEAVHKVIPPLHRKQHIYKKKKNNNNNNNSLFIQNMCWSYLFLTFVFSFIVQ